MRLVILFTLALCACASPPVRCDKHLQPINVPAPKQAAGAAGKAS